ncbi:MAG: TrmJ/YjtD family RNA methyltransferase [Chloroflexi bacterium]|nr:TrmJ/YjtD family RNA methyltransferase [Chloroflexota bacterium]
MHTFDNICIILYEPQDIANIGGVLRVMMNFGLSHLRLVRPVPHDSTLLEHFAHRSAALVAGIRHYETLLSAIADTSLVIGTTARARRGYLPPQTPRDLVPALLAETKAGRVVLLFGREDFGLPDEALSYCHRLLTIPTNSLYSSLNLAQAVALVSYELWMAQPAQADTPAGAVPHPVPARFPIGEVEAAVQLWFNTLQSANFVTEDNAEVIHKRLRQLLLRANPDHKDLRLVRALAYLVLRSTRRRP